jgi:hypothetical protein
MSWLIVSLFLWVLVMLLVLALCLSVSAIDERLAREDDPLARYPLTRPRTGAGSFRAGATEADLGAADSWPVETSGSP